MPKKKKIFNQMVAFRVKETEMTKFISIIQKEGCTLSEYLRQFISLTINTKKK